MDLWPVARLLHGSNNESYSDLVLLMLVKLWLSFSSQITQCRDTIGTEGFEGHFLLVGLTLN